MANTVGTTSNGRTIAISAIDSDYDPGRELAIDSIELDPGAAGDVAIFTEVDATGPRVTRLESLDGAPVIKYFTRPHHVFLDFSISTLSSGAVITILTA